MSGQSCLQSHLFQRNLLQKILRNFSKCPLFQHFGIYSDQCRRRRQRGHHSVIQVPGKDEYYIIYHRRPLDRTGGSERQVCIDKLEFDEKGFIKPVKMTFEGVAPVTIK